MIEKIQIIHRDFKESLSTMPYESVGRVFMALIAFANDEDPTPILADDVRAITIFPTIKEQLIRNDEYRKAKAEAGSKGGKAKTSKAKQTKAKSSKTKQVEAPYPNPYPNPNNKNIYGVCQNVLLTEEEHSKIISSGLTELIDELSLYMDSKGAKYKSHYSTILAWGRRREKEKKTKENNFTKGVMTRSNDYYDYDKLIKN